MSGNQFNVGEKATHFIITEVHETTDQLLSFVSGSGEAYLDGHTHTVDAEYHTKELADAADASDHDGPPQGRA